MREPQRHTPNAALLALALLACAVPAPGAEPAPPPGVEFILDETTGSPGELVTLRLGIRSSQVLKSASFAIDFDERQLRIENVTRIVAPASPILDGESRVASLDNGDDVDGNQTLEGWVHIELGTSDSVRALDLPLAEEVQLFNLEFRVLPNAVPGFTPVEFKDLGPIRMGGLTITYTNAAQVVDAVAPGADFAVALPKENLDPGGIVIQIIGEVGFFLRGDSNMDFARDVSDPIRTLNYLFQGETFLTCEDAADANDDGKIDLSDSVFTLNRLFSGGNAFPEPNERKGPDRTEDRLGCDTD
jgi:hypothetical protein